MVRSSFPARVDAIQHRQRGFNWLYMKTALYLRGSTDKQELENQFEPLKKFEKGKGLKVVQVKKTLIRGSTLA